MTTSRQIYRPDPVQRPGRYPSAGRLERLERMVLGMHGVASTFVGLYPNGIAVGGSAGLDLSKFCFGMSIKTNEVTVKAGEVHWGITVIEVPERNMPISEDYSYIGLETNGVTATLIGPSTNVSTFRSDNAMVRIWLYQFRYTPPETEDGTGSVSLQRIGHLGNWILPGNFA